MPLTAEQHEQALGGAVVDAGVPGGGGSGGGAPCWYLTGAGDIIRGSVVRSPDWEDRKAAIYGGLKFLGRAEYGSGGDCLPALQRLVDRNPELQPIIDINKANKVQRQQNIANRAELKLEAKAKEKAMEGAAMAVAVRQVLKEEQAAEAEAEAASDSETPRQRGGKKPSVD